jgi:hypothetical protein
MFPYKGLLELESKCMWVSGIHWGNPGIYPLRQGGDKGGLFSYQFWVHKYWYLLILTGILSL